MVARAGRIAARDLPDGASKKFGFSDYEFVKGRSAGVVRLTSACVRQRTLRFTELWLRLGSKRPKWGCAYERSSQRLLVGRRRDGRFDEGV
jgi:hypothetical protein